MEITCESCHSSTPHKADSKANDHTDKVACQSCHIPKFARVNPTKMSWDWSQAGKLKDGKPYSTEGAFGKHDYLSIKGTMVWDKDVKPEYYWFNGSIASLTALDGLVGDHASRMKEIQKADGHSIFELDPVMRMMHRASSIIEISSVPPMLYTSPGAPERSTVSMAAQWSST